MLAPAQENSREPCQFHLFPRTFGPPTPLSASRSPALTGRARVPGDKSISHRALDSGGHGGGINPNQCLLEGEDVHNTAKAMRALGAKVEREGEGRWSVHGVASGGFRNRRVHSISEIPARLRLVMGAVAGCPITAVFDGECLAAQAAEEAHPRSAGADRARMQLKWPRAAVCR